MPCSLGRSPSFGALLALPAPLFPFTDHRPIATGSIPSHLPLRPSHPPGQRGQVVRRPSPAGYRDPPTAGLTKTERGPIVTIGPSLFSMSPNRAIASGESSFSSTLAATQPLT